MMKKYNRVISIILLFFIFISFLALDYVQAQSITNTNVDNSNSKLANEVGVGAVVVLSIWGIYKLIKSNKAKNYEKYLKKGKFYFKKGNYSLAINNFEKSQNLNDTLEVNQLLYKAKAKYKDKHYGQGIKYLKNNEQELAYKEFNKVRKYDSNYLDVDEKYNKVYNYLKKSKLKRIGVLDFEDTTYMYDLGSRATSLFEAQLLTKEPKFIEVIERDRLNAIFNEQRLGVSGFVEPSTAKELGNILGVDYLVVGKVLSGNVSTDKSSEYVDVYYEDEEKLRYTVKKEAYTQLFFKLLDVNDGKIILSDKVKKKVNYEDSYYEGDSAIFPSNEELIDEVLTRAVDDFAQAIYDKYEL